MKTHSYLVYMITNPRKSVLYTGVTNNLPRRLTQHYLNRGIPDTFAGKYFYYNLVWYEWHQYINNAISKEKQIKRLSREEKETMISEINPEKRFLNSDICGMWPPSKEMLEAFNLETPDDLHSGNEETEPNKL